MAGRTRGPCGGRRLARDRRRRDTRPRRRVRLRQARRWPAACSGSSSRHAAASSSRTSISPRSATRSCGGAGATCRWFSRSDGLAQPAAQRGSHGRRAADAAHAADRIGAAGAGRRGAGRGGARRRAARPLPASALGRAAPAREHRPRHRDAPAARGARRAHLGAGRLAAGAGDPAARRARGGSG